MLGVQYNRLDKESKIKSLDKQKANRKDVKFIEELNMQRLRHNES